MKKFLIVLSLLTTAFVQNAVADIPGFVHEYTVDLYYANGVLADEQKLEKFDWMKRAKRLKVKYPSLRKALKFGEVKLAYNASYLWGLSDLAEVILQYRAEHPMAEITWQLLSKFVEKKLKFDIGELIEKLGQITSSYTLSEQADAYMERIKE